MKNNGGQAPHVRPEATTAFRTATVAVSVLAALALAVDYGFRPLPAAVAFAVHTAEIVALLAFAARAVLLVYWAPDRLQRMRTIWYEPAVMVLLAAALIATSFSEAAERSIWYGLTVQAGLVLFLFIRLTEFIRLVSTSRVHPAQMLVLSFGLLVVLGTGLLMLPAAVSTEILMAGPEVTRTPVRGNIFQESPDEIVLQTGEKGRGNRLIKRADILATQSAPPAGFSTALFTATSAVCVTGLTVVSTGGYWSPFGQVVILVLVQLGGLGIMTFGAVFALILWQNLGFRQSVVMQDMMTPTMSIQVGRVLLFIVLSTVLMELLGAWALWNLWDDPGMGTGQRLYTSVFHSVSAFCNAGFSLYDDSLERYRLTWQANVVFPALIVAGGLGFLVFYNLMRICRSHARRLTTRLRGHRPKPEIGRRRVTLQSKLVLVTTVVLLVLGTATTWLFETLPAYTKSPAAPRSQTVMAKAPPLERLTYSWFHSVTSRTAGFNVTPTAELTDSSKFLSVALMFTGASPGSTGGGIKTATLAVIVCGIWSLLHNRTQAQGFKRTIPHSIVQRSLVLLTLSVAVVVAATMILSTAQPNVSFLDGLFETTSAFGTVGLSTGITPSLNLVGRLLIVAVMFIGRVGPLTLFISLPAGVRQIKYEYPTESVAIG